MVNTFVLIFRELINNIHKVIILMQVFIDVDQDSKWLDCINLAREIDFLKYNQNLAHWITTAPLIVFLWAEFCNIGYE